MCIAVYKPEGQKMPSKKIFSKCFSSNSDGAGFMFPYGEKVHYEKGFMSFSAFKKGLKNAIKKYGISTKDTPMVFHFRITSQGGIKPELTHPFPLSRSYDEMRKLKGDCDVACVHNGIIDFASSYSAVIDYSDTMEFIREIAFPLINKNPNYYDNNALMSMLRYLLKGNRFAIMDGTGHVELVGDWIADNGIFYSNHSYEESRFTFKTTRLFDYPSSWREEPDPYDPFYDSEYITKEMEKEFLDNDTMHCDCGGELILEYLYKHDMVIAYCPDCGVEYKLTRKAEEHGWAKGLIICDYDEDDETREWNDSFGYKGA